MLEVGDVVDYKGREFAVMSVYKGNLCRIAIIRDGSIYHGNNALNYNIVNLDIKQVTNIKNEDGTNKKYVFS